MAAKRPKLRGPASLFRGKIPKPVSLTLTPAHHRKATRNKERLDLSRSDLIGLLIDKYADMATTAYADAHNRLRDAVAVFSGALEHRKRNQPRARRQKSLGPSGYGMTSS